MRYLISPLLFCVLACSGTETGNPHTGSFELFSVASTHESVAFSDFSLTVDSVDIAQACDGSGKQIAMSGLAATNLIESKAVTAFSFSPDEYCVLNMQLRENAELQLNINATLADGTPVAIKAQELQSLSFAAEQPIALSKDVPNLKLAFDRTNWAAGIDWSAAQKDEAGVIELSEASNQNLLHAFEQNLRTSLRQIISFLPNATRHYPGPCSESVVDIDPYVIEYEYDEDERLIGEIRSGSGPYSKTFEYDTKGRLLWERRQITEPSERKFEYDNDGRLISVEQSITDPHVLTFEYDAKGRVVSEKREGPGRSSYVRTYAYDDVGRLAFVEQRGSWPHNIEYTYDANDRLSSEKRTITGLYIRHYEYDAKGNLLRTEQEIAAPAVHLYSYSCWEEE